MTIPALVLIALGVVAIARGRRLHKRAWLIGGVGTLALAGLLLLVTTQTGTTARSEHSVTQSQ